MIDIGCECHGFYQLWTFTHVETIMYSLSLIHAQLGHPNPTKMQQFVPMFVL